MAAQDLLAELERDVPEVQRLVGEHLQDYGELLLHLLAADLLRYAIEAFDLGQTDVVPRLLVVLDRALLDGDDYVNNAIAVSFVEDTGCWDASMQPFIDSWPPGLQAEVSNQKRSRPT